jgi:type IV pilus assembly protein PilB
MSNQVVVGSSASDKNSQVDVEKNDKKSASDIPEISEVNYDSIDAEVLRIIPEDTARKYRMGAIDRTKNVVRVALEDPSNIQALNVLRFLAQKEKVEFDVFVGDSTVIDRVLSKYDSTQRILENVVKTFASDRRDQKKASKSDEDMEKFVSNYQDAPVAKLVDVICQHAIEGKASDIHIEPIEKECRVRFRVDGVLHSSLSLPKDVGNAVVARIKILSNLKIDERRKPQDGRFRLETIQTKKIDFRVSTLPVLEGEKVVMRVLDKDSGLSDMKSLGLVGKNARVFEKRIREPYGIILITGPTGSGKSTTLYTFLRILNKETTNIVTLEDPVEYFLEGINQSQVRPEIGYTFASGLRSILRQDPNVIMVGEIRDTETGELSIHAALTGHLVFSTLHTNTAVGAIPRLLDMGIEGFLLASSLRVVAAQRLVRRVCDKCKVEEKISDTMREDIRKALSSIDAKDLKEYGVDLSGDLIFYKGTGCSHCDNTGYKGRVAIYEVLEVGDDISDIMAQSHVSDTMIEKKAAEQGMVFMKQDGLLKALKGLTSLSEIERVTEGQVAIGGDLDDDTG